MAQTIQQSGADIPNLGTGHLHGAESDALFKKITWRLLPLLFLCYLFAFLDRINVGYAKLQMSSELQLSEAVYGLGAGMFFVSYLLFEVPSNIFLERIGARLTMLRIMVLWGCVSAATSLVSTPAQFYVTRFLLGMFEAGFFPGIILYLTYWYPSNRRGAVTGMFMFAVPVAGIIGGPISGYIMTAFQGTSGMSGWQWMFILEAIPSVLLGLVCYFWLADNPAKAKWLDAREKDLIVRTLAADHGGQATQHHGLAGLRKAFTDRRIWILAFVYFTTACANYTFTFWLPTMIKSLGVSDIALVGWYSSIPYVFAGLGVLLISKSSDKFRERRWHVAGGLLLGAIGLGLTTLTSSSLVITLALLCFVGFFQFGAGIIFWAIPPTYLSREAAPAGIALVSSIGVIGGFVSPTLLGFIKTATGSLDNGIYVVGALMVAGACTTLLALPSNALRVGPR